MRGMNRLLPLFLVLTFLLSQTVPAQEYVGTTPAPEFPSGLDWINTSEPITLESLRGRIVLLDFWTYGCINCVHVIPDLAALQAKYDRELVVIGVHSAKFTNEAETDNIALVADRYGRNEPIVNDAGFDIWRSYRMNAWPGFILIDPEGKVVGRHAGEGIYDLFDEVIGTMVEVFTARGTLQPQQLNFSSGVVVRPRAALRFPGKVLADAASDRLFIADSGNNRIVVADLSGKVVAVVGSGTPELRDGSFTDAGFHSPQGMALDPEGRLYVADTGNHSLRLIDFASGQVSTVAGTGSQEYMFGVSEVDGLVHGLNSPWDVLWLDGLLYVAMAGQHQVWSFDPESSRLELFAGSGREVLQDGPRTGGGLNQPSGLASDGEHLFVADSEASAIRSVELTEDGVLETLVGTGLFDFGDVDGTGDEVRLQHPLGIDFQAGQVYLADTYNHSIKVLDPQTRTVERILGSGVAGFADGQGFDSGFHEPGGISVLPGLMFVADTNNHAIRVVVLESSQVQTLSLSDPDLLLLARSGQEPVVDELVQLEPVQVAAGPQDFRLLLSLPGGYKANNLAPLQVRWRLESGSDDAVSNRQVEAPEYPLELELAADLPAGEHTLLVDIAIYYCQEEASQLCLIRQARLRQPLITSSTADVTQLELQWQPPALP